MNISIRVKQKSGDDWNLIVSDDELKGIFSDYKNGKAIDIKTSDGCRFVTKSENIDYIFIKKMPK